MSDTTKTIHQALSMWLRPARATLIRLLGSIDRGSDASQEAAARALHEWPIHGQPDNPRAWLITVGYRFALDQWRRSTRETAFIEDEFIAKEYEEHQTLWRDDVLRLMFTCCHPALSEDVRIALTLHTILDWSYDDIAHALLLPVDTLAQRVLRGKRKIAAAGIAYEIPSPSQIAPRIDAVLRVIYLLFNAGYFTRNETHLLNEKICLDAINLSRELMQLLPQHADIAGLYALLLYLHARAAARFDNDGLPILLPQQDRQLWDKRLIAQAHCVLQKALRLKQNGPYQIQAAINAVHADANHSSKTDWRQIALLYDHLLRFWPSPIVTLNQVVALLELGELKRADALLQSIHVALAQYQAFYLVRANWHQLNGNVTEQNSDLKKALALSTQTLQSRWLTHQINQSCTVSTQ